MLYKSKCLFLNPKPHCCGIGRQGPFTDIRSPGWNPDEWDVCPSKRGVESFPTHSPCEITLNRKVSLIDSKSAAIPWG